MVTPKRLAKLMIGEVSGVDDPANEIPGWMVAKSASDTIAAASNFKTGIAVGPDQTWDVGDAEARIRAATGAVDGPTKKYASCFLWHDGDAPDGDGDGIPDRFGDYKFLVCDVIDDAVKVMPRAVRAAASRLPGSSIPTTDKDAVRSLIDTLQTRINKDAADGGDASIMERLLAMLHGKGEIEVTKDELTEALTEQFTKLGDVLAGSLSKSVETPPAATGAGTDGGAGEPAATETVPAATVGLTAEDLIGPIEMALEPVVEIIDKTLDRIARIESALAIRKSLDGQEGESGGDGAEKPSELGKAIGAALQGKRVELH